MTKAFKSGLIVFIILIVVLFLTIGFELTGKKDTAQTTAVSAKELTVNNLTRKEVSVNSATNSKNFLATITIQGTIEEKTSTYNQEWIINTINSLKENPNNIGLALFVNSPGGAVYQADELYLTLLKYKEAGKLIYTYHGPLAASGGYYISCASDYIFANRNTLTGSIGVISGQYVDASEFLENLGIYTETIYTGDNKVMGSITKPLTEEQKEIMQEISDECYEQFISVVSQGRKIPYDQIEELADGRVYTASQALDNGLIDGICSWDDMIETMRNASSDPDCKVISYIYNPQSNVMDMLFGSVSQIQRRQTAASLGISSVILEQLTEFNSYPAYLYK